MALSLPFLLLLVMGLVAGKVGDTEMSPNHLERLFSLVQELGRPLDLILLMDTSYSVMDEEDVFRSLIGKLIELVGMSCRADGVAVDPNVRVTLLPFGGAHDLHLPQRVAASEASTLHADFKFRGGGASLADPLRTLDQHLIQSEEDPCFIAVLKRALHLDSSPSPCSGGSREGDIPPAPVQGASRTSDSLALIILDGCPSDEEEALEVLAELKIRHPSLTRFALGVGEKATVKVLSGLSTSGRHFGKWNNWASLKMDVDAFLQDNPCTHSPPSPPSNDNMLLKVLVVVSFVVLVILPLVFLYCLRHQKVREGESEEEAHTVARDPLVPETDRKPRGKRTKPPSPVVPPPKKPKVRPAVVAVASPSPETQPPRSSGLIPGGEDDEYVKYDEDDGLGDDDDEFEDAGLGGVAVDAGEDGEGERKIRRRRTRKKGKKKEAEIDDDWDSLLGAQGETEVFQDEAASARSEKLELGPVRVVSASDAPVDDFLEDVKTEHEGKEAEEADEGKD